MENRRADSRESPNSGGTDSQPAVQQFEMFAAHIGRQARKRGLTDKMLDEILADVLPKKPGRVLAVPRR